MSDRNNGSSSLECYVFLSVVFFLIANVYQLYQGGVYQLDLFKSVPHSVTQKFLRKFCLIYCRS